MKMTDEISQFDIEFLNDFLDDILNSDFIDNVVKNALNNQVAAVAEYIEPTKIVDDNRRPKVGEAESNNCLKRKRSNEEPKQSKVRRSGIVLNSSTIDILKRAVERINNAERYLDDISDGFGGVDTISYGTSCSSHELTEIENETRQQIDRTYPNGESIPRSQIDDQPHLQQIVRDILKGVKVMIIMRGPPGCGKSFLAREIIDRTTRDCHLDHIFSACDFFYNRNGCFKFNPIHVRRSHQWNQEYIYSHARSGWSPIIVDNTNTKLWEMDFSVKTAVHFGYLVEIVKPNTPWSNSADALVAKNIHDVPKATIERMIKNYESATVNNLFERNSLKYTKKMPQYRLLPTLI